jgi:hypothetical protein
VGENSVMLNVSTGDLIDPGLTDVRVDVGHTTAPIVSGTSMSTDHVATEFVLGLLHWHCGNDGGFFAPV